MATITPNKSFGANSLLGSGGGGTRMLIVWESISDADSGGAIVVNPRYADRTVAVSGTFAGAIAVTLEGSMDGDTWHTCHSAGGGVSSGDALTFSAAGAAVVAENFVRYRVSRTGGGASPNSDVNVYLLAVH